jgi:hypothetical protein
MRTPHLAANLSHTPALARLIKKWMGPRLLCARCKKREQTSVAGVERNYVVITHAGQSDSNSRYHHLRASIIRNYVTQNYMCVCFTQ